MPLLSSSTPIRVFVIDDHVAVREALDGIRRAARGLAALSPRAAEVAVRAVTRPTALGAASVDALTSRETQIMKLLAGGLQTQAIATQLAISPKTVDTHRARIYAK